MPDLPTLTLPQDQFDRVVAAFPGATNAEKVANYKNWLTNRVIERVGNVEASKAVQAVKASLPPLAPEPPLI
jgi:hypothetical protein